MKWRKKIKLITVNKHQSKAKYIILVYPILHIHMYMMKPMQG